MYWQSQNGLYGYNDFWKGVASGDYNKMQEASATYYPPQNGKIPSGAITKNGKILDLGRWNFRKSEYFQDPDALKQQEMIIHLESFNTICMGIPLGFVGKILIFRLGFVIFVYNFPLGFVRKDNNFLCVSKKMSTFAPA